MNARAFLPGAVPTETVTSPLQPEGPTMRRLALLTALALTTALPAHAQKYADTLGVAWCDQIADVEPSYNNLRTGLVGAHHAWDGLVYRNPEGFVMQPLLATEWKWIDD